MAATRKDVLDLSLTGEFDDIADHQVDNALAEALTFIHVATWDAGALPKADKGQALLAAHILVDAMRGDNAPIGPLIREQAGALSHAFAAPAAGQAEDTAFNATRYGRRYLALKRTLLLTPVSAFDTVPE